MSRGTAMSISSSGRASRSAITCSSPSRSMMWCGELVVETTRSTSASCSGRLSKRIASPSKRWARPSARSWWRLATKTVLDAAGDQRPGDQFGGGAGADHQHLALGEVAERALRDLDRDRRDRDAALADRGLVAGPPAGRERAAEEAVEDRPGGALDQRQLVGAFDLALDLGLADDHRVEPGGHPQQVAGGVGRAQRVEVAEQLGRPDLRLAGEHAERLGLGLRPGRRRPGRARSGCRSRSPPPR